MAKYGGKSQQKIKTNMDEMKKGNLKIGKSNKKVTNPKQAIAIGLSEARKEGGKVPPPKKTGKKAAPKKAKAAKKANSGRKPTAKK